MTSPEIDRSHQSPNHSSRRGHDVECIVLHSTEGAFDSAVAWLCNPDSGVSSHYVIAKDGRIAELVSPLEKAWHAGVSYFRGETNVNAFSIGIEMEHFDGQEKWPDEQVAACSLLCAWLCYTFKLPDGRITSHAAIARPKGRKVDPQDFPWESFSEHFVNAIGD